MKHDVKRAQYATNFIELEGFDFTPLNTLRSVRPPQTEPQLHHYSNLIVPSAARHSRRRLPVAKHVSSASCMSTARQCCRHSRCHRCGRSSVAVASRQTDPCPLPTAPSAIRVVLAAKNMILGGASQASENNGATGTSQVVRTPSATVACDAMWKKKAGTK